MQSAVQPATPISHVVIVTLENRSFDNLFNGYPDADSSRIGKMHDGTKIALTELPLVQRDDIGHGAKDFQLAFDGGRMDGFDLQKRIGGFGDPIPPPSYPYAFTNPADVQPYWILAARYTLADRMFQSNAGPSYPSHFYLIAAQSAGIFANPTHIPWGCDAPSGTTVDYYDASGNVISPGEYPCIEMQTIADELDAAHITWKSYTPKFGDSYEAYESIRHIRYGTDWRRSVVPSSTFFTDASSGQLPAVSWVIPTFVESDHPKTKRDMGPSLVASIVNAVGGGADWNSTAIFIMWDDWGGWYDHVRPPQLDRLGLGFRVPLIVVSPYANHGYVSHLQHENASIVKFIEQAFRLPSLGQADVRADNLLDCFNFTQPPSPFRPIPSELKAEYFMHAQPGPDVLDDDFGS